MNPGSDMPYQPHIRMTMLGRLGQQTQERFAYSVNLGRGTESLMPVLQPNADVWNDLAADAVAFHGSDLTHLADRAILEEVKFASIGTDGKYIADPYVVNVPNTPGYVTYGANVGSAYIPPQSAIVVSLSTERRGPRGRGRFYLPMPVAGVEPQSLTIADAQRDQIEASAADFLGALNNQPGLDVLDLRVVVASSKAGNAVVTGVRVGRTLDTVRSRRRSLLEDYGQPRVVPGSLNN